MNHSCDPNLWWGDDLTLIARRDIKPGEEITYDYATTDINPKTMPDVVCNCGSVECRKIVTYKDCLNLNWQKNYENHTSSWVKKFIKEQKT